MHLLHLLLVLLLLGGVRDRTVLYAGRMLRRTPLRLLPVVGHLEHMLSQRVQVRGRRGDGRRLNLHWLRLVFEVRFRRAARILVLLLVLSLGDVLVVFVVDPGGSVRLGPGRASSGNTSNTTATSTAASSATATATSSGSTGSTATSSTSYPTPRIARVEMIPGVMLMVMMLLKVMVWTRLRILALLLLMLLRLRLLLRRLLMLLRLLLLLRLLRLLLLRLLLMMMLLLVMVQAKVGLGLRLGT